MNFEESCAFGRIGEENVCKLLIHFAYKVKWLNKKGDSMKTYDIVYKPNIETETEWTKLEVKRQTSLKCDSIILELSNKAHTKKGWFNKDENEAQMYCFNYGNRFVFIARNDLEKAYESIKPKITDFEGQCQIAYLNLQDIRDVVGIEAVTEYEVEAYKINSL